MANGGHAQVKQAAQKKFVGNKRLRWPDILAVKVKYCFDSVMAACIIAMQCLQRETGSIGENQMETRGGSKSCVCVD